MFLAHQSQWCLVLPESAPTTKILMKTGTHGSVFSASDLLVSDELLRGLRGVENSVNGAVSDVHDDKRRDGTNTNQIHFKGHQGRSGKSLS